MLWAPTFRACICAFEFQPGKEEVGMVAFVYLQSVFACFLSPGLFWAFASMKHLPSLQKCRSTRTRESPYLPHRSRMARYPTYVGMHIKSFEEVWRVRTIRLFVIVHGQNGFSILHPLRLNTYLPMPGEAVDPFAI